MSTIPGFRDGDIVVSRMVPPGWIPYFQRAGGFVCEVGGWLSHTAIVAREFNVPLIVQAKGVRSHRNRRDHPAASGRRGGNCGGRGGRGRAAIATRQERRIRKDCVGASGAVEGAGAHLAGEPRVSEDAGQLQAAVREFDTRRALFQWTFCSLNPAMSPRTRSSASEGRTRRPQVCCPSSTATWSTTWMDFLPDRARGAQATEVRKT